MAKSAVVTMYFNLKNLNDAAADTRPPEFYLNHGRGTLQLQAPMIIFCDETTQPLIQAIRDTYVNAANFPTVYIVKNFTYYDYYNQLWPIIAENRAKSVHYKNPGDRNTASYYLVCMFKTIALQIAAQRNDFNATHYFWIDFASGHVVGQHMVESAHRALANPKPKVSALYIRYRGSVELQDLDTFLHKSQCGMACTAYSVEAKYVDKFYSCMWSIFYDLLYKGFGHNDEQVMTLCYNKYPELFNLYYGDYYSVLANYHHVRQDWNSAIWHFINNAIPAGRHDLAFKAAQNILESVALNLLTLPIEDKKYMESIVMPPVKIGNPL